MAEFSFANVGIWYWQVDQEPVRQPEEPEVPTEPECLDSCHPGLPRQCIHPKVEPGVGEAAAAVEALVEVEAGVWLDVTVT